MQTAAILIVGDEILSGEITDLNGPHLVQAFAASGVSVERIVVVPDRRGDIVAELVRLRGLADAVVVSGGIGPTHDDVTRPAVADALGVPLELQAEAEARIRAFYAERVTDAELGMARMPLGARLVSGVNTPTFGFALGGVFVLPGVPFLFADIALRLPAEFDAAPLHRETIRTRRREGEIASGLARCQGDCLDVAIGSYPVHDEDGWHVRVVLRSADPDRLAEMTHRVRAALADE